MNKIKSIILNNVFRTHLVLTSILIGYSEINAQISDTLHIEIQDGWIEKMSDKMSMDVSLNNSYEIFEIKTPTNKFNIHPNTPTSLRFKFNYRFLSVGFQFAPDFIPGNGDKDLKGDTKSFGIGTSLILKHYYLDLSYSKVKGYYLENSDDYITWEKGDPYIQFPDLNYQGFAIGSGYLNNPKFSFRSLVSQSERQLKSAGSFIPVFNFRYYIIDDKSSGASTQKSNNIETSIGPGYAYTFVAKEKFYLSLGLLANFGYLNTKLTTRQPAGNVITKQDNFIFRWDGKTGIGYNGSKFYTGLYTTVSGTKYKQENTTAMNFETRVFYHLFFGIRFKSPDYLKRQVTKIENKFL